VFQAGVIAADRMSRLDGIAPCASLPAAEAGISERQRLVLQHVAMGYRNRAIARRLRVSENTIKWHLKQAFRRLGACNRVDAIRLAQLRGLVQAGCVAHPHDQEQG
jgi:DNA-binding NarL/FixJ family response regulator